MNGPALYILAEFAGGSAAFWDFSRPPEGAWNAGLFFLLLVCLGLVADIFFVVYALKRPVKRAVLAEQLAARAWPWQMVGLVVSLLLLFYLVGGLLVSWVLPDPEGGEAYILIVQALLIYAPLLLGIMALMHLAGVSSHAAFDLRMRRFLPGLGLALFFYLALIPPLWFYSALYQFFLQHIGYQIYLQDAAQALLAPAPWPVRTATLFVAVIIAPFIEELLFRGIMLPFLARRFGLLVSVLMTSAVFAVIHFHVPSLLPLFLLSIAFSFAYARTGSLWVPFGMHALFNGVTVIFLFLMGAG